MQSYNDPITQLYERFQNLFTYFFNLLLEKLGLSGAIIAVLVLVLFGCIFILGLWRVMRVIKNWWVWLFRQFSWQYPVALMFLLVSFVSLMPFVIYPAFQGPSMPMPWEKSSVGVSITENILLLLLRSFVVTGATTFGVITLAGVLTAAQSSAAWLYGRWLERFMKIPLSGTQPVAPNKSGPPDAHNPLQNYQRIGIVLAGGGAKGSYQAGALKAIYEFINECGAHHKVKMLAATSIGSWNALFWLARLISGENNGKGALQEWWESLSLKKVIQPTSYVPFYKDYLFSPKPWKRSFEAIFGRDQVAKELNKLLEESNPRSDLHFYFTSTNIRSGTLECTTNNREAQTKVASATLHDVKIFHQATEIKDLRDAVFTSMALPLVFEPVRVEGEDGADHYYEDGGVIDNLPIWFGTELEECDLLFILPLNASFEREVGRGSLLKRLLRTLDIRQGVLERRSLRTVGIYNKLTHLQNAVNNYGRLLSELRVKLNDDDPRASAEIASLLEEHPVTGIDARKGVDVFAICPGSGAPGSKSLIGTVEFWKNKDAGRAFTQMEAATRRELERFSRIQNRNNVLIVVEGDDVIYRPFSG